MVATPYLNRLGLDAAADERAVKRAYARELKQIDQEADAAGFQLLRQAYEMALEWVRHKPAGISFAPAVVVPVLPVAARGPETRPAPAADVAPPAAVEQTGETPQQLAQAVFDDFLVLSAETVANGNGRDSQAWRKHLQRCASDERLLNLSAAAGFEFLIARLLAEGWRDGHEGLFVAARQVFLWEKDRRRLKEFGRVGAWLNQAIDECGMFSHQQSGDCSGQADAVTRVREDAAPSKNELMTHVPHLSNMLARFPAWTSIVASRERIEAWRELERAVPGWRRRLHVGGLASSAEKSGPGFWWKLVLCFIAIRVLFSLFGSTPDPKPRAWNPPRFERKFEQFTPADKEAEALYRHAAGALYMPPGTRTLDPSVQRLAAAQSVVVKPPPVRPQRRPLNDAELKAISKRMRLEWPRTSPDTFRIEFGVELDERGAIKKLTRLVSSGLPVQDKKVEDAIRSSAPFGKEINRNFKLGGTWHREPPKEKTAPPPAATADEATP